MKKDYITTFPKVRYSSSKLLTDENLKDISNLLQGSKEAKQFALKMEDVLSKSKDELDSAGEKAQLNYGDSMSRIIDILDMAKGLDKKFVDIPIRKPTANPKNDWKTNKLISHHLERPAYLKNTEEFSLWTIRENLKALITATELSIKSIEGEKGLIEHPIHYFAKQAISIYTHFFKQAPSTRRNSKFVQAIDIMVKAANILPNNQTITIDKILKNASENKYAFPKR
jgi:hypothetical protein